MDLLWGSSPRPPCDGPRSLKGLTHTLSLLAFVSGRHSVVLRQIETPSHAALKDLMARIKLPGPAKAGHSPSCVLRRKWISENSVILSFFPSLYKTFWNRTDKVTSKGKCGAKFKVRIGFFVEPNVLKKPTLNTTPTWAMLSKDR